MIGTFLVFLMSLTDVLRRLMRPALTIYVMVAATWVTKLVWDVLQAGGMAMSTVQASLLFAQAVDFIFFMASTFGGYWFADRAISKNLFEKYGK